MENQAIGVNPNSPLGKDVNSESSNENGNAESESAEGERHIPYSRLKKEVDRRKAAEARAAAAEKLKSSTVDGFKYDPSMPVEKAFEMLQKSTIEAAKAEIRREREQELLKQEESQALVEEAFDILRDEKDVKISSRDEKKVLEVAEEYGLDPKNPRQLKLAYLRFEDSRKSAGSGKSKDSDTKVGTMQREAPKNNGNTYQPGSSWTSIQSRLLAKLQQAKK